jgi:hypothetical protein
MGVSNPGYIVSPVQLMLHARWTVLQLVCRVGPQGAEAPKTMAGFTVPKFCSVPSVAKGRKSSAIVEGDVIGEMLYQHKVSVSSCDTGTSTIPEEGEKSEGEKSDGEVAVLSPKPQPLEPIVIISRPSLSEEEEAEAEQNIIVVDGSSTAQGEGAAKAEVRGGSFSKHYAGNSANN